MIPDDNAARDERPTLEQRWTRLGSWWQAMWVIVAFVLLAFAFDLVASAIITGQPPEWTGFGPDTSVPSSTHIGLDQPAKTLWDWLQLLIIPGGLAVATIVFTRRDASRQKEIVAAHNEAEASRREMMLATYIDRMAELLYGQNTRADSRRPEIQGAIRVRTATTMRRLDAERNKVLVDFLRDSELLKRDETTLIDLTAANLSGADLRGVNLAGSSDVTVDLSGCTLIGARLSGAYLNDTILAGANLSRADLSNADLSRSNLSGADLRSATLRGATLAGADLTRTKLPQTV